MTYEAITLKGEGTQGAMGRWGNENLLLKIRQLATGRAWLEDTSYSGTGDGSIGLADSAVAAPSETWTITVTNDASPGSEVWSVSGSVSGAQASATTGVAYDNGIISFLISAGAIAFVNGDQWTLTATASNLAAADRWLIDFEDGLDFAYTVAPQFVMHGPDISGFDPVYVGFSVLHNVAGDYYNIVGYVGTGWVPGSTAITDLAQYSRKTTPLWQFDTPLWLVVNDRRIAFGVAVENIMDAAYYGLYLPYFNPGEYPYPALALGSVDGASTLRYSDATRYIGCMGTGGTAGSTKMQHWGVAGGWLTTQAWPWMTTAASPTGYGFSASENAPLEPVQDLSATDRRALVPVFVQSTADLFGELEGVFYISGFALVKQDVIQEGAIDFIVVGNIHRTGFHDYLAIKLD